MEGWGKKAKGLRSINWQLQKSHRDVKSTVGNTEWGKSRFTVVHKENNTIINNKNIRINCFSYNCKPTFAPSCRVNNIVITMYGVRRVLEISGGTLCKVYDCLIAMLYN